MHPPSSTQLWELLAQSRLVDPAQLHALRQSHASLPNAAADDVKAIARWLVGRGAITIWQARRLIAGKIGPFFVGDYRLLDQRPGDGEGGLFTARHEPSGRDVSLVLLNGRRCADPIVWTEIVNRTTAANRAVDPLLSRTWALEQAGGNRFIVCEHVTGETLASELTRRGPLPLAEAGQIALAVAAAVAESHAAGSVHGGVSLDTVLREPPRADGTPAGVRLMQFPLVGDPHAVPLRPLIDTPDQVSRLGTRASFIAPELTRPGVAADTRSDVYALGCLVHALVSGRPPCWKGEPRATLLEAATVGPAALAPPAVPVEVATLIGYLTARDPAARYQTAIDATQAIATCFGLAAPDVAGVQESAGGAIDAAMEQVWPDVSAAAGGASRPVGSPVVKRKRGGGAGLIAALLVGLGLAGAGGYYALSSKASGGRTTKPVVEPTPAVEATARADHDAGEASPVSPKPSETSAAETAPEVKGGVAAPAAVADRRPEVQVVDDPNLPWESPTKGEPPALAYLPPNAQWLLLARPAAMLANDEASLFAKALGPGVEAALAAAASFAGCEPGELESVQAGWLAPSTEELVTGLALRLVESKTVPDDEAFRARAWAAKRSEEIAGETVFVGNGLGFWLPRRERGRVLVVAPLPLMEEIIADAAATQSGREKGGPAVSLDRDLETLVEMLDADRHLTLAGLPLHLLTNGRPTALVGPLARLADPLAEFCGEDVKAAAVSLHFGADFYAEVDAVTALDLPAAKAAPVLAERLARLPDDVESFCTRLAPDPYGGRLVMRLPGMLRSLAANLRAGAEPNAAVLNVVLPRHAGHNIALAAELALAQSPSGVAAVASAAASAEPTDALGKLEKKMTLVFAKDTLEKTIQMISDEAGVPMEIVGPDLQLEGITKNQSFGLDEQDKTAKQILKAVLQKANPDGKLVYVVTKQDGAEAILITTRAAAEKRGDTLAPGQ